jgi:hypothetical protein
VYSAFQARSIQRLDFLTTFADASPDGPPGDYSVTYRCQYTYNQLDTNPTGNLIQVPVRACACARPDHAPLSFCKPTSRHHCGSFAWSCMSEDS